MGDRRPRQPKFTLHQWSGDNIRFGWLSPLSRCFSHRFEIGNNIYSLDLSRICEIDSGIYTHTYIYNESNPYGCCVGLLEYTRIVFWFLYSLDGYIY